MSENIEMLTTSKGMHRSNEPLVTHSGLPFAWEGIGQELPPAGPPVSEQGMPLLRWTNPIEQPDPVNGRVSRRQILQFAGIMTAAAIGAKLGIDATIGDTNTGKPVSGIVNTLPLEDQRVLRIPLSTTSTVAPTSLERQTSTTATSEEAPLLTSEASVPPEAPSQTESSVATTEQIGIPEIVAAPAVAIDIPQIGLNSKVLPYTAVPIPGKMNNVGGQIFEPIDPPTETEVFQWTGQWGDPGTVFPGDTRITKNKQMYYGHTSDIGRNLVFQNLEQLQVGSYFTITNANGAKLTFQVYETNSDMPKAGLEFQERLFALPSPDRVEAVLVSCKAGVANNVAIFGVLTDAQIQ